MRGSETATHAKKQSWSAFAFTSARWGHGCVYTFRYYKVKIIIILNNTVKTHAPLRWVLFLTCLFSFFFGVDFAVNLQRENVLNVLIFLCCFFFTFNFLSLSSCQVWCGWAAAVVLQLLWLAVLLCLVRGVLESYGSSTSLQVWRTRLRIDCQSVHWRRATFWGTRSALALQLFSSSAVGANQHCSR